MQWILTQSIPPETKLETKDDASIVEDEATWPEIVLHPKHNSETNKDDSKPVKEEPSKGTIKDNSPDNGIVETRPPTSGLQPESKKIPGTMKNLESSSTK